MPSRDKYSDEHRIFLQGIMCRGVLNEKEVHSLHDKTLTACGFEIPEKKSEKDQLLVDMIQTINAQIRDLGLLIKKGQDEDTGKSCFMLVNLSSRMLANGNKDLGTSVQSMWSTQQLEYLRLLATDILQSDDKTVSSRDALNLTDRVAKSKAGKKMSLEEAEGTVNKLIEGHWIKAINGKLTLSVRFIGEMETWMVEVMGAENIAYCKSCRKLVVRGKYCECSETIAWHNYCLEKQTARGVDVKCPECGAVAAKSKGKRAEHSQQVGLPSQLEVRGEARRSSRDESDEEVEMVDTNSRSRHKSGGGRRRSRDDSDDAMESQSHKSRHRSGGGRIRKRMSGDSGDSDSD